MKLALATILIKGGFGAYNKHEVKNLEMRQGRYAQYEKATFVRFVPKGKRNVRGVVLSYRPEIVVYEGHGHAIEPESMRTEYKTDPATGMRMATSRRSMCNDGWSVEMLKRVKAYGKQPVYARLYGASESDGVPEYSIGEIVEPTPTLA